MATQKKQDLLKQLDVALNRKVQQKYYKNGKTQQLPNYTQTQYAADRYKKQSIVDSRQYTTRQHKSPIQFKKSIERQDTRSHKQLDPQYNHAVHDKIKPSQIIAEEAKEKQLIEEILSLKKQNKYLNCELNSFKNNIQQLEQQSRMLKRDEKQYLALKHQNSYLLQQIQVLKKQNKIKQKPVKDNSLVSNLDFEEIIKSTMMQLNLSFLTKQWNQSFILEAIKNINKQVNKLIQQKSKLKNKLNKFDLDSVLAKQNNHTYKQQINQLKMNNQNLSAELQACKLTISQMDQQFNLAIVKNKQIQNKYKQISKQLEQTKKQLEGSKKQLKMVFESSRHRKPKRQSSVLKRDKQRQSCYIEDSNVLKNCLEVSSQTSISQQEIQKQQQNSEVVAKYQIQISSLSQKIKMFQQLHKKYEQETIKKSYQFENLNTKYQTLEEQKFEEQKKTVDLQEKVYHCEQYIKQLEQKSQEINKDISHFMPQLKLMEEQNIKLKQSHLHKDQQLINKHKTICQLNNKNEQLQEQVDELLKNHNKNIAELDKKSGQISKLNQQFQELSGQKSYLENSMFEKEKFIEKQLTIQIIDLKNNIKTREQQINNLKNKNENELQNLKNQNIVIHQQLQSQRQAHNNITKDLDCLKQRLRISCSTFDGQKQKLKEAIQQIMIINRQLTKKQTQYESICHNLQNKILSLQNVNNQVNQGFSQLQITNKKLDQELRISKNENQKIVIQLEESKNEIKQLRIINEKTKYEAENSDKLRKFLEQSKIKLQAKNTQLLFKIGQQQKQKVFLSQKVERLEIINRDRQNSLAQLQQVLKDKTLQFNETQQTIKNLSQQNMLLSQDFQKVKQSFELDDKSRVRQLSNQQYDIERLVRQNKDIKSQLDQVNKLAKSKQFQQKETQQHLETLQQQNRSLNLRLQYLKQELEMKDRNRQEDKYIVELKQQQYCLLVKRILSNLIQLGQLQYCQDLEELLEIGSQKVMEKKKYDHQCETIKVRDSYVRNQVQPFIEPSKNLQFGTQIKSYEVLLTSRHRKELENKLNLKDNQPSEQANTPRSFIFDLSPLPDKKEEISGQKILEQVNRQ